jgi:DNA polymerase-1
MATLLLATKQATKRAEYLRSWLGNVSQEGFIHSTYWPGRVVTGRLSSDSPNMQQVTKVLRPAFIASSEDKVLVDLDYSQIELRVAAFVARCWPMIQAYAEGKDLHRMLAAQFGNVPEDDVTPENRQKAKAGNFGLLYGMHALGLRDYAETNYGVSLTYEEAQDMYYAYFSLWDGLSDWHARVVTALHRDGFITSPIGRVRRLPGIHSANGKMVSFAERAGINSPIQGFASDLMQMSAASIQGLLPGTVAVPNTRIVGTVHDSIVAEVPRVGWEEPVALMQERMTGIVKHLDRFGVNFDVPLAADASCGTRWSWDDVSNPK